MSPRSEEEMKGGLKGLARRKTLLKLMIINNRIKGSFTALK